MKDKGFTIGSTFIDLKNQIINESPRGFEIIATVFGTLKEVKKDLMPYIKKGYEFYYYQIPCSKEILHTVRIMQKQS